MSGEEVGEQRPVLGQPGQERVEPRLNGMIAEVCEHVHGWRSCGHCTACRSGDVVHCRARQVPGLSYVIASRLVGNS